MTLPKDLFPRYTRVATPPLHNCYTTALQPLHYRLTATALPISISCKTAPPGLRDVCLARFNFVLNIFPLINFCNSLHCVHVQTFWNRSLVAAACTAHLPQQPRHYRNSAATVLQHCRHSRNSNTWICCTYTFVMSFIFCYWWRLEFCPPWIKYSIQEDTYYVQNSVIYMGGNCDKICRPNTICCTYTFVVNSICCCPWGKSYRNNNMVHLVGLHSSM